jgi:hypothetical protein
MLPFSKHTRAREAGAALAPDVRGAVAKRKTFSIFAARRRALKKARARI